MKITYWDAVLDLLNYTEISGPVDGPIAQYTFHKNQTAPTEEEIQAKIAELEAAEPMRLLRLERNQKLTETDWRMHSDYPGSNQEVWRTYRQALRDLPNMIEPDDSTEPLPAPTIDQQGQLIFLHWPEVPK